MSSIQIVPGPLSLTPLETSSVPAGTSMMTSYFFQSLSPRTVRDCGGSWPTPLKLRPSNRTATPEGMTTPFDLIIALTRSFLLTYLAPSYSSRIQYAQSLMPAETEEIRVVACPSRFTVSSVVTEYADGT